MKMFRLQGLLAGGRVSVKGGTDLVEKLMVIEFNLTFSCRTLSGDCRRGIWGWCRLSLSRLGGERGPMIFFQGS